MAHPLAKFDSGGLVDSKVGKELVELMRVMEGNAYRLRVRLREERDGVEKSEQSKIYLNEHLYEDWQNLIGETAEDPKAFWAKSQPKSEAEGMRAVPTNGTGK